MVSALSMWFHRVDMSESCGSRRARRCSSRRRRPAGALLQRATWLVVGLGVLTSMLMQRRVVAVNNAKNQPIPDNSLHWVAKSCYTQYCQLEEGRLLNALDLWISLETVSTPDGESNNELSPLWFFLRWILSASAMAAVLCCFDRLATGVCDGHKSAKWWYTAPDQPKRR